MTKRVGRSISVIRLAYYTAYYGGGIEIAYLRSVKVMIAALIMIGGPGHKLFGLEFCAVRKKAIILSAVCSLDLPCAWAQCYALHREA